MISKLWDKGGVMLIFAILLLGAGLLVPNFTSSINIKGLLLSVTTVGMISCTMLFCLAGGDFDLSVGSTVAVAGVIVAIFIRDFDSLSLGIAAALGSGAVIGFANGFVIAKIGINALITTLATMQIVRGAALLFSKGSSIGVSDPGFLQIGLASPLGIQSPIWMMFGMFLIFGILLNKTTFGRNTLAIGGNQEAAKLAGVNVVRTKIIVFMLQGLVAAFAGVVLASRISSGQPTTAEGLELQVISACVLGGVSLTGGIGTISGTIFGVLIMGIVQNAMNLKNIEPFWQLVVSGSILLVAVMVDRLRVQASR
ncbi:MAG: L-arabinose ABC transporter permease AraH [Armatimonadota bacterium]|nr:L-arabinose ABC transporter permease AraH [Armatimonadota bacterium]